MPSYQLQVTFDQDALLAKQKEMEAEMARREAELAEEQARMHAELEEEMARKEAESMQKLSAEMDAKRQEQEKLA